MKTGCGLLAVCALVVLGARAEEKFHIFTDTQGRCIEAQIVRYDESDNKVTVQPKGRAAMTVPITIFSDEDQTYIVEWSHNHAFLDERKLVVDFSRRKAKNTGKTSEGDSSVMKAYDHYFSIKLENKSKVDLEDITLEYVVFYTQDHWVDNRQDTITKAGSQYNKTTLSISSSEQQEIDTTNLCLRTYRESGYVGAAYWKDLDSDCEGIMVKLSKATGDGETITRYITYPDNLKKAWTTETEDAQGS